MCGFMLPIKQQPENKLSGFHVFISLSSGLLCAPIWSLKFCSFWVVFFCFCFCRCTRRHGENYRRK